MHKGPEDRFRGPLEAAAFSEFEVPRGVKSIPGIQATSVVILTCSNHESDIRECYKLGANSYVQKPVDFDVFCKVIRNMEAYWLQVNLAPPPSGQNVR